MMSPYWKAKWLAALRSGNYTQGHGQLRTEANEPESNDTVLCYETRFCCLGVLCEVVKAETGILYNGESGILPDAVRHETRFTFTHEMGELIQMNDVRGKDFGDIADYIERVL